MIIAYGNNDDSLSLKEVTKEELTEIVQSNEIVTLVRVENHEIDDNGFFDVQNGITSIGDEAFEGCTSLTNITLPESLTSIGCRAFALCSSLTTISLPESLTNIKIASFALCSSLTTISLPKGLTNIGFCAFLGCSSLTTITLPEGLTNIGLHAFKDCPNLQNIIIDGDENEVERVKALLHFPALLPKEARDKVISKSLVEDALLAQKEAIIELAATPQLSSLYEGQAFLKVMLPDSILGIINSYLIDDKSLHPIFHIGRQEIERIPLTLFITNPEKFRSELMEVKNNYRALAEKNIKPSIKWQFYDDKQETPVQEEITGAEVTKRPYN